MNCREALKEFYQASDNRPKLPAGSEAKAHLEQCPNCQNLVKLDQAFKETVRQKGAIESAPLGLSTRIQSQIEALEDLSWKKKLSWLLPGKAWGWASTATVMVAVLLLIGIWTLGSKSSVVEWFLEEQAEYVEEGFKLELVSSDPSAVDNWFVQNVGFSPNAGRFLRNGLQIVGGKKMEFAGMKSALACIDKGGVWVGLYSVPSASLDIENLETRKVGEKEIWVGTKEGFNIVVWKEKEKNLTCSLVAQLPLEELIALVSTS